jgi:hypothetical protein
MLMHLLPPPPPEHNAATDGSTPPAGPHPAFRRRLASLEGPAIPPEILAWVNEIKRLHDEIEDLKEDAAFHERWLVRVTRVLQREGLVHAGDLPLLPR